MAEREPVRSHGKIPALGSTDFVEPEAMHDLAISEVKRIGFTLAYVSRQSESCYYRFPGRFGLLRLSKHGRAKGVIYDGERTCASASFNPAGGVHTENEVFTRLARAIGAYFLRAEIKS